MDESGFYMATNEDFFPKKIPKKFGTGCTEIIWKIVVFVFFTAIFFLVFLVLANLFEYYAEQKVGIDDEMRILFSRIEFARWIVAGILAFLIARFNAIVIPNPFGLATLTFGSRQRVRKWGFNIIIPLFESRVTWVSFMARPRQINVTKAVTQDGFEIIANANDMIAIDPDNAIHAVFDVEDFVAAMDYFAQTSVNSIVGDYPNSALGTTKVSEALTTLGNNKAVKAGGIFTEFSIADHPFADEALAQIAALEQRAKLIARSKLALAEGEVEPWKIYKKIVEEAAPDASSAVKLAVMQRLKELDSAQQIAQQAGGSFLQHYNIGRLGGFESTTGRDPEDFFGEEEDNE